MNRVAPPTTQPQQKDDAVQHRSTLKNPFRAPSTRTRRRLSAAGSLAGLTVLAAIVTLAALSLTACERTEAAEASSAKKVIVLGFDGMDYGLTKKLMAEGRMPNFQKLADMGGFSPLGTAIPPQSPVAWSDFITGMDAGGHGIFDFVHRDPKTMEPYLSTSRSVSEPPIMTFGRWQIPGSGKVELLRHGEAFWQELGNHGVETSIYRMPANFPPSGTATRELSGMGVPDINGDPGRFSFYTSELFAFSGKELSGGEVYEVDAFDNEVHAALHGPNNPFLQEPQELTTDFTAYIDPVEDAAKIVVGDEERLLKVGEWSDWVPFELEMIPTQKVPAMVRFYLRQVRPEFELYASPINIDPENQALPVSYPADFAEDLAKEGGRFYTQGMPEDTKSLSDGVLDRDEFLAQTKITNDEIKRQYKIALSKFDKGLLFYYFGDTDQVSHMMWRSMDPDHPAYDPQVDAKYADVIPSLYQEMDGVVGYTLEHMDPDTVLVVMSDHGFMSWRRAVNLNSWLRDHGYLVVKDPTLRSGGDMFSNVDWSRTKAYGLGINGLYINLKGREKNGIVDPADKQALMDQIEADLLGLVDPSNGAQAVSRVFQSQRDYHDRGYLSIGPDMLVGYALHYRGSNESALGELTPDVFSDNTEAWSGDHCIDPAVVPGILLTSQPLPKKATKLENLAAAVLSEFGVERFPVEHPTAEHPAP